MDVPSLYREPATAARIALIPTSFERLLGRPLTPPSADVISALWDATDVIVAHGTEEDPLFFFANQAALLRFESDASRFLGMPSRLSAEAQLRPEREAFLGRVAAHGYVDDYCGVRISARGRRFEISRGIVWNLVDPAGKVHGQAATFAAP